MTCGPCQDLLLDYLYGLLDEAETENLRVHLDDCPGCRAALQRATLEKTRIGHAARAIPDVPEFRAPDSRPAEPPPTPAPAPAADVPVTRTGSYRPLAWGIVAAMAACVVLFGVVGIRLNGQIGVQSAQVSRLKQEITTIDGLVAAHDEQVIHKQRDLPETVGKQVVQWTVSGPSDVVRDVTAPITVSCSSLDGKPHKDACDVEIVDPKGKLLSSRRLAVDGWASIPSSELAAKIAGPVHIRVKFADADGKSAVIDEPLRIVPKSYGAHLAVNKEIFRPGENVFVRALFVDRWTLKVPDGPLQAAVVLADGDTPKVTQTLAFVKGMAAATMTLPPTLPPGVYTLRLNAEEIAPTSRTIEILAPEQPNADVVAQSAPLHSGEKASVPVQVYLPNGDPAANTTVTGNYSLQNGEQQQRFNNFARGLSNGYGGNNASNASNDAVQGSQLNQRNFYGNNAYRNQTGSSIANGSFNGTTDAKGQIGVPVTMPTNLETNNIQFNVEVQIEKKEKAEAWANLRVVPTKLAVDFHPEGGRLVAGAKNRVYYRVRTPLGETAEGRVVLRASKDVLYDSERAKSVGVFEFVPDVKEKYQFRVAAPKEEKIDDPFAALGIQKDGVLVRGPGVQSGDQPIHLDLENVGRGRLLQVLTSCRGEIVDHQRFRVDAGRRDLEVPAKLDGIHRVSVFEIEDGPMTLLAERLVYRQPTRRLDVTADLGRRTGNRIELRVAGVDEAKRPIDFIGLASVCDDRYVSEQPEPSLSEQFLVLGDPAGNPIDEPLLVKPAGLDLALGVLGWRAGSGEAREAAATAFGQLARGDIARRERQQVEKLRAQNERDKQQAAKFADENAKGDRPGDRFGDGSADAATFFCRVQPNPTEIRDRVEAMIVAGRRDLEQQASKSRQALLSERDEAVRQRNVAEAELASLESQPRELALSALGALTLGSLIVGTLALLWGFARMVRGGSASLSFGVAFAGIAACLLLLMFQPQQMLEQGRMARANKDEAASKSRPATPMPVAHDGIERERVLTREANVGFAIAPAGDAPAATPFAAAPAAGGFGGGGPGLGGAAGGGPGGPRLGALQEQMASARQASPSFRGARAVEGNWNAPVEMKMAKGAADKDADRKSAVPGQPNVAEAKSLNDGRGMFPMAKKMDPAGPLSAPGAGTPLPPSPIPTVAPMLPGQAPPAALPAPSSAKAGAAMEKADKVEKDAIEVLIRRAGKDSSIDPDRLRAEFSFKRSIEPATLLWNPVLIVPAAGASLSIDVPAGPARYRILILGHTEDGRFGSFEDRLVVTPTLRNSP